MKAKKGAQQALVATAHKLARTFYVMLKHRQPYRGKSAEEYEAQARKRDIARLTKQAHKLGLNVVLPAAQPAGS